MFQPRSIQSSLGIRDKILSLDTGATLVKKIESFGWEVFEIDGHNEDEILSCFNKRLNKPVAIVANTVKGKGVSIAENNNEWHHKVLTKANYDQAMEGLIESREES